MARKPQMPATGAPNFPSQLQKILQLFPPRGARQARLTSYTAFPTGGDKRGDRRGKLETRISLKREQNPGAKISWEVKGCWNEGCVA